MNYRGFCPILEKSVGIGIQEGHLASIRAANGLASSPVTWPPIGISNWTAISRLASPSLSCYVRVRLERSATDVLPLIVNVMVITYAPW